MSWIPGPGPAWGCPIDHEAIDQTNCRHFLRLPPPSFKHPSGTALVERIQRQRTASSRSRACTSQNNDLDNTQLPTAELVVEEDKEVRCCVPFQGELGAGADGEKEWGGGGEIFIYFSP